MGEDRRGHGAGEVLPPFAEATKEREDSLQVRDGALDARAEALRKTELGIGLAHRFLLASFSLLGDGDQLDLLAEGLNGGHVFIVTLVRGDRPRVGAEQLLVTLQRRLNQLMSLAR